MIVVWVGAFAGKPAPTDIVPVAKWVNDKKPVGAGLPAKASIAAAKTSASAKSRGSLSI
jgi:hypothetical protein